MFRGESKHIGEGSILLGLIYPTFALRVNTAYVRDTLPQWPCRTRSVLLILMALVWAVTYVFLVAPVFIFSALGGQWVVKPRRWGQRSGRVGIIVESCSRRTVGLPLKWSSADISS
jgi:hypothetical protein